MQDDVEHDAPIEICEALDGGTASWGDDVLNEGVATMFG